MLEVKSLKKDFIHFLFFSFLMTVLSTAAFASPEPEVFPPLPQGKEMPFFEKSEGKDGGEDSHPDFPKKNPDNIMHYRGTRVYDENLPFEISHIKCVRLDDNVIGIDIVFNQSINPHTIGPDSILINGVPLPKGIRFAFNRRGDTIKMVIIQKEKSFKLLIQNMSSFNGKELEAAERLVEPADKKGD